MSLFGSIQMAGNSLQANQIGLQVVGQNIANASTPGYSREQVEFAAGPSAAGRRLTAGHGRKRRRRSAADQPIPQRQRLEFQQRRIQRHDATVYLPELGAVAQCAWAATISTPNSTALSPAFRTCSTSRAAVDAEPGRAARRVAGQHDQQPVAAGGPDARQSRPASGRLGRQHQSVGSANRLAQYADRRIAGRAWAGPATRSGWSTSGTKRSPICRNW